jgi:hypothetical protein
MVSGFLVIEKEYNGLSLLKKTLVEVRKEILRAQPRLYMKNPR